MSKLKTVLYIGLNTTSNKDYTRLVAEWAPDTHNLKTLT